MQQHHDATLTPISSNLPHGFMSAVEKAAVATGMSVMFRRYAKAMSLPFCGTFVCTLPGSKDLKS